MPFTDSSRTDDIEKNSSPVTLGLITLSWSGLTYQVNGNTILDGVSGQLASGQLLAVMGPSGMLALVIRRRITRLNMGVALKVPENPPSSM